MMDCNYVSRSERSIVGIILPPRVSIPCRRPKIALSLSLFQKIITVLLSCAVVWRSCMYSRVIKKRGFYSTITRCFDDGNYALQIISRFYQLRSVWWSPIPDLSKEKGGEFFISLLWISWLQMDIFGFLLYKLSDFEGNKFIDVRTQWRFC